MPARPTLTHPTDATLGDFVVGRLTDPDDAAVVDHLGGCPQCLSRAAVLHPEDTLTSLVAAAGTRADARLTLASATDHTPPEHHPTVEWTGPAAGGAAGVPAGLVGHPRYRLVRPLGEGGMGAVWLAEHAVMGRMVALKVIHPGHLARPGAVERFRREVRAAARLHHPNIVTAFDADEAGGTHFLVMEYVPGETLLEAVRRGPLPVDDACRAVRDAARGLAHAHAAGLIHRDVKPGNLIRAADGTVQVLDFGLVGLAAGGDGLTGENVTMGTPDYIAPEQATDAAAADARSDVYALGCTLYHLLAGRVPYPTASTLGKLDAHRNRHVRPTPIAGLPPGLAAVLARLTATDPAARYPTAVAAAEALEPFCTAVAAPLRRPRVWPWVAVAAGLVFALMILGAVYSVRRGNEVVTVETDDPDVEVTMRRNGEVIRIVDAKTKKSWELDAKNARLTPDGGELTLDLPDGAPLVLRRNGAVVATIRRTPAAAPIPAAVGAAVELHRVPFAPTGWSTVSPDGAEFLAFTSTGGKREAVIFDTASGKETGRCPMPVGAGELVYAWFIPGSRDLLVSDDLRLGRYDRATGAKRADLFEVPVNTTFAPLPAGGTAAAVWLRDAAGGYGRHRVVVRDLATGAERFRVNPLHPGSILGMAPRFSPDGKLLATTDTTPTASAIRLWDAATGKLVRTIDVAGALGSGNAFSADGQELVADYSTVGGVSVVGRWAVATGEPVRAAPVAPPWPSDYCEYLLAGRVLGYRGENGSAVRFVATATGAAFADYRMGGMVRGAATSADGRVMLFATDAGLRVIRVPTPPGP